MARARSRGHPFLQDKPKGVWLPEAVGVVPGYPKTEELWQRRRDQCREQVIRLNAEGRTGRRGVPDGWAGRKQEAKAVRAAAQEKAERAVKKMIELDMVHVPQGQEERAELALTFTARVILDATENTRERLQAAKLLAEYTAVKPAAKQEITVNKAEDFLNAVLASD